MQFNLILILICNLTNIDVLMSTICRFQCVFKIPPFPIDLRYCQRWDQDSKGKTKTKTLKNCLEAH